MQTENTTKDSARDVGQEQFTIPELRLTLFAERERLSETARKLAEAEATIAALLAMLQDVSAWLEIGLAKGQINRGTANRDGDLVSQIRAAIASVDNPSA